MDLDEFRRELPNTWLHNYVLGLLEKATMHDTVQRVSEIHRLVSDVATRVAAEWLGKELRGLVSDLLECEAIPYLAAWRYTDTGLEKYEAWTRTWEHQRREDAGETTETCEVPPAYSQGSRGKSTDYRENSYWSLRGKLDVPKERFQGCSKFHFQTRTTAHIGQYVHCRVSPRRGLAR